MRLPQNGRGGFRQKAALFHFLEFAALCRDAATAKFSVFSSRVFSPEFFDAAAKKNSRPPAPGGNEAIARRRVLAQWRGVDLSPLETAKAVRARAAGDVVSRVLKDLHIDDRRAEAELVKVWNSLIDPNITAHAQPANLRKGTLFVNVDSSVWLSEIVRYRRKEILDRLQHSFGKNLIQKISYRVG